MKTPKTPNPAPWDGVERRKAILAQGSWPAGPSPFARAGIPSPTLLARRAKRKAQPATRLDVKPTKKARRRRT